MFAQTLKEKNSFGMMGIAVLVGLYVVIAAFVVAVTVIGRAPFEQARTPIEEVRGQPQISALETATPKIAG